MSISALGYAFGLSLPANEKWLLVCLADYADDWGDSIFPAVATLAEKSGMSDDSIKRAFKKLLKRGVIERVAASTPVSPAFYRIVGVAEPTKKFDKEPTCPGALRRAVLHLFACRCEYCGELGTKELGPDGKPWTVDRVVAGQRGGVYTPDNVTLSCRFCNTKKRTNAAPAGTRTLSDLQGGSAQNAPSLEAEGGCILPPSEGVDLHPGRGAGCAPILCIDPLSDPLEEKAGALPRLPRSPDDPEKNLGVITKLAHEVFAVLGFNCGDDGDIVETVKSRCARLGIVYSSLVVKKAVDSARWQSQHGSTEAH